MKKLIMLLCTACLLWGCTCSQKTIQYNVAKNYFFSNNASLPASLKVTNEQKGNTLLLNYKVIRGKKQSYYTQPFFILVVNRKYIDKEVIENNASKE